MDKLNEKDTNAIRYYLAQQLDASQKEAIARQRRREMQEAMEYAWEAAHLREGKEVPDLFGADGRINYQIMQDGAIKSIRGNSPIAAQQEQEKPLNEDAKQ